MGLLTSCQYLGIYLLIRLGRDLSTNRTGAFSISKGFAFSAKIGGRVQKDDP